ncbi:MAG: ABC transporter permease, partial [Blautia sp.]|nr:ABC transporter permease [Blautia sp.]
MENIKQNPIVKKLGFNRIILFCILVLLYAAFSVAIPGFAGMARIMSILNYVYFLGFLALGVTFVIATGGIDFSIGPVMFCCALMAGYSLNTYKIPVAAALIMSIVIGFCFGLFNGWLVAFVGVPPFIVSMASMNIAKGLGSVFTKTQSVSWPQANDPDGRGWFRGLVKVGNIPTGLIIFAIFVVILFILMNNTKPGRYILSLGSNKEAVRLSGVNVRKWQMLAYVICGTLVGIAAIFFVSAYTTVQPGLGDTYNNEAIASCVMGGTSMA